MTMIAARIAPARVAAAILNDLGPVVDPRGLARIAAYVGKSEPVASWRDMAAAVKSVQNVAFPGRDDEFWATFAHRVARRARGRTHRARLRSADRAGLRRARRPPPDLMALFDALVPLPLLVVRGALSDLLSPDGVAAMPPRQARPFLYRGRGHPAMRRPWKSPRPGRRSRTSSRRSNDALPSGRGERRRCHRLRSRTRHRARPAARARQGQPHRPMRSMTASPPIRRFGSPSSPR